MARTQRELKAAAKKAVADLLPTAPAAPITFDRENAFQLFATFCGDVERTAHALNVPPVQVLRVAEEEHWMAKLKPIIELKKSARPGDVERAINRAINFSQAHRLRMVLECVIAHYSRMPVEDLIAECHATKVQKDGSQVDIFQTKPFADLAAALERCHNMSYASLNDSMGERTKRQAEDDIGHSAREIDTKLEQAMNEVGASQGTHAQLFDAQIAIAEHAKPKPVDDTHEGEDGPA